MVRPVGRVGVGTTYVKIQYLHLPLRVLNRASNKYVSARTPIVFLDISTWSLRNNIPDPDPEEWNGLANHIVSAELLEFSNLVCQVSYLR